MNMLFVDVETTGTDSNKNVMVELAARLDDSTGKTITRFTSKFFNPKGTSIDIGALKVNKVKIKELLSYKPEDGEIASFIDWLVELPEKVQGPIVVCGHNVHFDMDFIKAALHRYSVAGIEQVTGYRYEDTSGLGIALVKAGILKPEGGKVSLASLAKALGIDVSQYKTHTADGDVDLTAEVYYRMITLLTVLQQNSTKAPTQEG